MANEDPLVFQLKTDLAEAQVSLEHARDHILRLETQNRDAIKHISNHIWTIWSNLATERDRDFTRIHAEYRENLIAKVYRELTKPT